MLNVQLRPVNNINYLTNIQSVSFKNNSPMLDEYILKSDLKLFFPDGIKNTKILQSYLPDCQLLASLDALINNKKGVKIIEKMFKLSPDKKMVNIIFPDKTVELDLKELKDKYELAKKTREKYNKPFNLYALKSYLKMGNRDLLGNKEMTTFGIYVLEHAYAKYVMPEIYEKEGLSGVMFSDDYHCDSYYCLKDILVKNVKAIRDEKNAAKNAPHNIPLDKLSDDIKDKVKEALKEFSKTPDLYIMTAGTIDCTKKSFLRKYGQWHEYSVRRVDYDKNKLTIVNPWNTSRERTITIDELMKNFDCVIVAKME